MTPDEIEQLFASVPAPPSGADGEDQAKEVVEAEVETALPEGEQLRRTESLSQVLATVQQLWEAGSEELDVVSEKIGNGTRNDSWRIPLGESQLLDFFVGILGTEGLRPALTTHTLRIVGNSCADTDKNRERVVAAGGVPKIVKLLEGDDAVLPIAIPVLFNTCVDYEPAQVAAYKAGLNPVLIKLISGPRLEHAESSMSLICKLLGLIANQEPEDGLVELDTPFVLLKLAAGNESPAELDDFLGQTAVALTYLAQEGFQDAFLQNASAAPLFLQVLPRACGSEFGASSQGQLRLDAEERAQLRQTQAVFLKVLADLSAHPAFAAACPLEGPEVRTLRRWVSSSSASPQSTQLRSAACLALGNLARSDAACAWLVQTAEIQRPLLAILAEDSSAGAADPQLLHSILGFLKNLAIPAANKPVLGAAGLLGGTPSGGAGGDEEGPVLPRLWRLSTQPQVQFAAVSLTRLLLVNCPENVRRVCTAAGAGRTSLQALLAVFKQTDQEPTKAEAARAVLSVCRVLHADTFAVFPPDAADAGGSSGSSEAMLEGFYGRHSDQLPAALVFLGSQTKHPLLRSELWFVLALMARSAVGARVVAGLVQEYRELLAALSQAVAGKNLVDDVDSNDDSNEKSGGDNTDPEKDESAAIQPQLDAIDSSAGDLSELGLEPQQVDPKQAASMTKVDRENGLVLINELIGHGSDDSNPLPLAVLRRMLKEGGDLVLASKEKA